MDDDRPMETPGASGRDPSGAGAENLRREGGSMSEQMSGMRADAAEKLGELGDNAREAIRENPWTASLTVFAVGLVTGAILGALFSRD